MTATANRFVRELLPPPRSFYERELGQLTRPDRRGWARANCPFHQSKSKKSFAVNLDSGGYFCHGCGAKGGDLIDFVRQRVKLDFKAAAKSLGAWREMTVADLRQAEADQVQRATAKAREAQAKEQKRQRIIEVRNDVHTFLYLKNEVAAYLNSLCQGNQSSEAEACWGSLALLEDALRESETAYCQLCGLEYLG